MKSTRLIQTMRLLVCLSFAVPAISADFHYSGFASIYAGRILDGESSDYFETEISEENCPCYVSNYPEGSYYTDEGWQFDRDTNYGVQAGVRWMSGISITGQIEGLGGNNFEPEFSWLYLRYQISENVSVDLGRKGLPLFYYSDFLNVGYARPWVRAPGEVYGWPIASYNGLSLSYDQQLFGGDFHASIWVGGEKDDNADGYRKLYYHSDDLLIEWSEMLGGFVEQDYNGLLFRLVAMTNKSDVLAGYDDGSEYIYRDDARQKFYGLAFMLDKYNIIFQSEYNRFEVEDFSSNGYYYSLGYRIEEWTPAIAYSRYKDSDDGTFGSLRQRNLSATLRWDVHSQIALKAQYDYYMDDSDYPYPDNNYAGDSELFTIGADFIF